MLAKPALGLVPASASVSMSVSVRPLKKRW
jgi:hypothetical protein